MTTPYNSSKSQQIKILLGVLSSGLVAGILFALLMLYYYSPSGSYSVENVLLDPNFVDKIQFTEHTTKGKSAAKFVFEGIEFSYFDQNDQKKKIIKVAQDKYTEFYKTILQDKSLIDPGQEVISLFDRANPAVLSVQIRSVGAEVVKGGELIFSAVEFVNQGDYYRVLLRQDGGGSKWVYFYHQGIYQETLNLFE